MRREQGWRRVAGVLGGVLLLAGAVYGLAWAVYWPAFSPARGIQQPLHYNETYVWPMPWTLHQAAPGVPPPAPLALRQGDTASQRFRACADNLALVRVWLAGEQGGEQVQVTVQQEQEGPALPVYAGQFRLAESGAGQYYNLLFPPIHGARGREFTLSLKALDGSVSTRVGYVDRIAGPLQINEFPLPGDMDVGAYHHGPPGTWTLQVIAERLLPGLLRARVQQYKPAAFKGAAFPVLCAALGAGTGLLLWALSLSLWGQRYGGIAALAAVAALLLAGGVAFQWDVKAMLALGQRVPLIKATPLPAAARDASSVYDLVAGLEGARRKPEPRQVQARLATLGGVQRPCIAVPALSQVTYGLRVPFDAELRLGLGLPEGTAQDLAFRVQVEGDTLLERTLTPAEAGGWHDATLDLRPYGGRQVQLTLSTYLPGLPLEFGGPPPGGALPVAGLWAAPGITSGRTWLAEPSQPETAPIARFGDQVALLGYEVNWDSAAQASGGQEGSAGKRALHLTLYWRALRPIEVSYTVFVHLLDEAGEIEAQQDSRPLQATYPTDIWPPGVVVHDEHVVPVPGDVPGGAYRLGVGLYELATMQRLPAMDGTGEAIPEDRVILDAAVTLEDRR